MIGVFIDIAIKVIYLNFRNNYSIYKIHNIIYYVIYVVIDLNLTTILM